MTSRLIVLSGAAGAGKDSVARILVERGWKTYSLAAVLKRFAGDLFGFTDEQLYGPSSARNAPDPRWARPCETCAGTGVIVVSGRSVDGTVMHNPCSGTGLINDNSPRRILQLLAEEWLRQMVHPDALTIRARPDIESMLADGDDVVVTDARYDNDRNNLKTWLGGKRVDVRRLRKKETWHRLQPWRMHRSETQLATDDEVEYVINNDERWPFPSLGSKVDDMLSALF